MMCLEFSIKPLAFLGAFMIKIIAVRLEKS